MSASIWRLEGKKGALLALLAVTVLISGCSNRHQYSKSSNRFEYYPTGQTNSYSGSSGGSSSSKGYSGKPGKLTKGEGSAAMHRATLRPYTTFGIRYYPKIEPLGSELYGISSWYGPKFHGKKTSCGETYDMHGMTAAHKTLPMHTIVDVTHRKSGKKVRVRINDRGPFVKGRIIDLSYTAGKILGLDKTGIAPVKVDVVSYDKYISSYSGGVKQKNNNSSGGINYAVQLASFANKESAENLKNRSEVRFNRDVILKDIQRGSEVIYRVVVAGFSSENKARAFIDRHSLSSAVVVAH